MAPYQFLVVTLLITAGALAAQFRGRRRQAAELRDLGARHGMHYSRLDRFALAPRVAQHFPVPGAADVRVSDLLYRSDETAHYYVFTVDYTRGVLGTKSRHRAVARMTEAKQPAGRQPPPTLVLGPAGRPTPDQYRDLLGGGG